MAVSNWKRLAEYCPVMRLIAEHARAQDPVPLPARVRDELGVGRTMWLAWTHHAGDATPPGLTIDHAQRIAASIGRPTSEVLLAARLLSADDLLFDRGEMEQARASARAQLARELLAAAERTAPVATLDPARAAGSDGDAGTAAAAAGALAAQIADLLRALGAAADRDVHEDIAAAAAPPS